MFSKEEAKIKKNFGQVLGSLFLENGFCMIPK
jgi:hypothetical protein